MTMITYSIGRHYSIMVSLYLKMWLVKIYFNSRIRFKPIHNPAYVPLPASAPSPTQASSETITAQLPGNSTTDDLPIAIQKDKRTCTQYPLFNFVSYSYLLFVHLFLLWTIARFSRMYQKHCLFQIELKQCKRRWRP